MTKTTFISMMPALFLIIINTVGLPLISSAHSKISTSIRLDTIKPKNACGCFAWQGDKILSNSTLIYDESGLTGSHNQSIKLKVNGKTVSFRFTNESILAKYHNSDKLKRIFHDTLTSSLYTIQSEWKTTKILPGPDGNESHFNVKFLIINTKNNESHTIYAKGYCGC